MLTEVLKINQLMKSFGQKVVLDQLNFSLHQKEIVAFLGPNGAGKSTTIKTIMGLSKPDAGSVSVMGLAPQDFKVKNKIGYTSQELAFPPFLKVREILQFVRAHFAEPVAVDEILERFDLAGLQKNFAGGLSGGQKRRLGLACALIGRPELLILDEPTTGLDIFARKNLWQEIEKFKAGGGSVLLSTHDLNEVEMVADRVLLIEDGNIFIDGTVDEIKKKIEYQKITYLYQEKKCTEMTQNADAFIKKLVVEKPEFTNLEIHPITLEEAFMKVRSKT